MTTFILNGTLPALAIIYLLYSSFHFQGNAIWFFFLFKPIFSCLDVIFGVRTDFLISLSEQISNVSCGKTHSARRGCNYVICLFWWEIESSARRGINPGFWMWISFYSGSLFLFVVGTVGEKKSVLKEKRMLSLLILFCTACWQPLILNLSNV